MGYNGNTFIIPMNRGGLFEDPNIDATVPWAMISPTRNLNLDENGRRKRGGTAHVNDAAFSGTPQVMGLYDFRLRNLNRFTIAATNGGKIYKNASTTIKTGMSTTKYFQFETFENELFICDGETRPQTWDGAAASTSDITSIPTDWSGSNFPKQLIKHGYGASERLWAFGCPSTSQTLYASENGDGNDFSDANVITQSIETGDGFGIIGGVEFGDRIFAVGKRKFFLIQDTDSNTANWGYQAVQWEGGAAQWRLIIKTPNDIICMMEDGEIYSVIAAETYGDYKAASLTRPAFMHRWIKEYVKLPAIEDFHGIYDPVLRAVKIFVVRNGQTQCDTALVYFIDRPVQEAWMIHDNQDATSGYSAASSALIRESVGVYKVYTGDYSGNVWELETANRNDNDNGYYAGFKTPPISLNNPRVKKDLKRGWISTQPEGDYNLNIKIWIDGLTQTAQTVSLAGTGGVLDSFTLGTSLLGGVELIESPFTIGNKGKRIQFEVYNNNADEDFFVSQMMIDNKFLGARPS